MRAFLGHSVGLVVAQQIQAIRGMNDCLPTDSGKWQQVEGALRTIAATFGYQEIRTPIVENTALFKRAIGEVTDIVEKEMYTFDDRNGDSLTLRPEGTASTVRAGNEHGLLYNQEQRLWYIGPMFRHERPQKGRYRQFHQFGIEVFGLANATIDAEVIAMSAELWQRFGISDAVTLEINSLGDNASRARYRDALVAYLRQHESQLDDDSRRRLESNPLRVLDSKNPEVQALLANAPRLSDHLDDESRHHFARLCAELDALGIRYRHNERLVRGLDYYNRTVFEWVTDALGAQGTVCAGGRYDGLVEQLGGKATPAVGFALGLERLVLLLDTLGKLDPATACADLYLCVGDDLPPGSGLLLARELRAALPGVRIKLDCGGGKLQKQFKRADKSGARFAVLLGADELAAGAVTVKPLRDDGAQQQIGREALSAHLTTLLQ